MNYRKEFDEFEKIVVKDELAKFLGVNSDGVLHFSYIDIVKSAGHSCITVAGAYIIALEGLKQLYKNELPKRGEIKVELKNKPREDNSGVVGFVLSQITGASTDYGFGGMPNGNFNRRDTLFFDVDMEEDIRLTRLDSNESVSINYRPNNIVDPLPLLMSAISSDAKQEDKDNFADNFQEMVYTLFNNIDKIIEFPNKIDK